MHGYKPLKYHGKMDFNDKHESLKQYESCTSNIIVSTSALCAGYNNTNVDQIIVIGNLHSFENVLQAFGRAGRKGQSCNGVWILTPSELDKSYDWGMDVSKTCVRVLISKYYGVFPIQCAALQDYRFCSICEIFSVSNVIKRNCPISSRVENSLKLIQQISQSSPNINIRKRLKSNFPNSEVNLSPENTCQSTLHEDEFILV